MERELKFRAWDGERMIYLSDLSIGLKKSKKISPYAYFATDTFGGHVKLGKHKLMQFTGLKDKNGKEIYEGDILRNKLSFSKGQPTDILNPIYKNYIVDWYDGCQLGYRIKNKHNIMPLNHNKIYNAQSEVIGNIYENPELLK